MKVCILFVILVVVLFAFGLGTTIGNTERVKVIYFYNGMNAVSSVELENQGANELDLVPDVECFEETRLGFYGDVTHYIDSSCEWISFESDQIRIPAKTMKRILFTLKVRNANYNNYRAKIHFNSEDIIVKTYTIKFKKEPFVAIFAQEIPFSFHRGKVNIDSFYVWQIAIILVVIAFIICLACSRQSKKYGGR